MIGAIKRSLSDQERQQLLHSLPSFLFRARRKVAQQELDAGVAEVLNLEIIRAWDMNGCRPPCCPNIYLFQVGEKEYVYAESWTAFDYPGGQFPRRRLHIVLSPLTKRILSAHPEGDIVPLDDSPFDPATDYFILSGGAECDVLQSNEMPEEVLSLLTAT